MIKKDYAAAAVLDFLREDIDFNDIQCGRYLKLLMEAQAFTMKLSDLMQLIDKSSEVAKQQNLLDKNIRAVLPFESVYVEYTHCNEHEAMSDVDRCCLFTLANHTHHDAEGASYPLVYMTIHYLNSTQLCVGTMVQHCDSIDDAVIELASRVQEHQKEFVDMQFRAMHTFTSVLMESIVNGSVTQYTPFAQRKRQSRRNNRHKKLLEYKMLRLDLDKLGQRQEPGGGTHASPRLHLRRGHWRHYKNGTKRWIKPMWVGDKDLGVIHKDYEVVSHG